MDKIHSQNIYIYIYIWIKLRHIRYTLDFLIKFEDLVALHLIILRNSDNNIVFYWLMKPIFKFN